MVAGSGTGAGVPPDEPVPPVELWPPVEPVLPPLEPVWLPLEPPHHHQPVADAGVLAVAISATQIMVESFISIPLSFPAEYQRRRNRVNERFTLCAVRLCQLGTRTHAHFS